MTERISWSDFERIEICAGTIIKAEEFSEARKPAYKLWVDLGPAHGVKRSSAQLTALYTPDELTGRQVICVCNFPEKQIGPLLSQVLVTGFPVGGGKVVLASPEKPVPNGTRLA